MGNNNCQLNCKKTETIKQEENYTINETEENKKNTLYTILKGKYFKSGKIICDFINFQYRRIYCKMQYNKMLFNIENLFIPENNQIPRIKEDYEQILNQKIENFFENKNDILKDVFDKTEFFMDINEFDNLKNMIKQYYANDIYNNKINFYNEFYEYVKEKNNLQNFIEEKRNKENEINVKFKTSIKKLMKIQKLISIKGKVGTLSDTQINFIQNDIENLFKICLSTSNEDLPKKLDDNNLSKKSYLLLLLSDEFKLNTKIFISGKLRIFIKLFYYIYIMKKYNFISSTNNHFYKIVKDEYHDFLYNEKYHFDVSNKVLYKNLPNKKKLKVLYEVFNPLKNNSISKLSDQSLKLNFNKNYSNAQLESNLTFSPNKKLNSERNEKLNLNVYNFYKSTKNKNSNSNKTKKEESIVSSKFLPTISLHEEDENILFDNQNKTNNNKKIINNNINASNNIKKNNENEKQKSTIINKEKKNNKLIRGKTKFFPSINSINSSFDIRKKFNRRSSRGKTQKDLEDNKKNLFKKLVSEGSIELYNGEYDKTLKLYAGYGTLIKPNHLSLYNGTFRYGKKEGIGIYYRQFSEDHFKYFMGEFTKNKFDGFGLLIEFNSKYLKIEKGIFNDSHFISGLLFIFNENIIDGYLEIIKYEGDLEPNLSNIIIYKNFGHLLKLDYFFNKNKKIYELENEYDYTGHFYSGKEEGKGVLRCTIKKENYSYEYKGNFSNGEINGYGIIEYSDNFFIKKYEGLFLNGKSFYKYGIVYFKSGDVYEGFFDEKNLKSFCGLYWHNNHNDTYDYHLGNDNYFGGFLEDKKSGFGRYVSYNDNLTKLLVGNYLSGNKHGLFCLIFNEEDDSIKIEKKKTNVHDITQTIQHIFSGIPIYNIYEFVVQRKKYFVFEKGDLMEASDKLIKPYKF